MITNFFLFFVLFLQTLSTQGLENGNTIKLSIFTQVECVADFNSTNHNSNQRKFPHPKLDVFFITPCGNSTHIYESTFDPYLTNTSAWLFITEKFPYSRNGKLRMEVNNFYTLAQDDTGELKISLDPLIRKFGNGKFNQTIGEYAYKGHRVCLKNTARLSGVVTLLEH